MNTITDNDDYIRVGSEGKRCWYGLPLFLVLMNLKSHSPYRYWCFSEKKWQYDLEPIQEVLA